MDIPVLILLFEIGLIKSSDPENGTHHSQPTPGTHSDPGNTLNHDTSDTLNITLDILSKLHPTSDLTKNETQHTLKLTYTPKHQSNFTEVREGSNTIWSANTQMKFAKKVILVQKKGLAQLVEVKNDHVQKYYKRSKSKFVPVERKQEFFDLEESLERFNNYIDKWVELDLSKPVSEDLFSTNQIYQDGVPIVEVKTLPLFSLSRVYDSEGEVSLPCETYEPKTLWMHENGLKIKSLIMYQFKNEALLNLSLTDPTAPTPRVENKVFKKEGNTWGPIEKDNLTEKIKEFKSRVQNQEIQLDVATRRNLDAKFYKKTVERGYNKELVLYPVMGYHLKKLSFKGTQVSSLGTGQRFSTLRLYLYKNRLQLMQGVVWEDEDEKETLYFMKTDNGLSSVDQTKYKVELFKFKSNEDESEYDINYLADHQEEEQEDSHEEEDDNEEEEYHEEEEQEETEESLFTREGKWLGPVTNVKFNIEYHIDEKYFRQDKREELEWEVRWVSPKEMFLVNLVDSREGVVWKSKEPNLYARSMELYFKGQEPRALKLYLVGRRINTYEYFKISDNKWKSVTLEAFYRTLNKNYMITSMYQ